LNPTPTSHPLASLCNAGNTCIIVGFHDDKVQPGQCRSTVGKLADFLKEQNI